MEQLLKLLSVFFQIGLFGIGGGYAIIPFIQELVVEKYEWVTQRTFSDIIAISQMTPGPLAVNASTFVGWQIAGIPGAFVATFGCIISGVCISILLYRLFHGGSKSVYVIEAMNGLKSASLGLIISAAATIVLLTLLGTPILSMAADVNWIAVCIFYARCLF
ncbi:chromate transporter [Paenibacillus lycopersici]|uniref:chromate transporter n=1 Tax=Paenibacillus lycopersici TaxID=2704462 RepID=UPI001CDBBE9C|nr:chromate transporter [Paenibacillus lycopersici]